MEFYGYRSVMWISANSRIFSRLDRWEMGSARRQTCPLNQVYIRNQLAWRVKFPDLNSGCIQNHLWVSLERHHHTFHSRRISWSKRVGEPMPSSNGFRRRCSVYSKVTSVQPSIVLIADLHDRMSETVARYQGSILRRWRDDPFGIETLEKRQKRAHSKRKVSA